MLQKYSLFHYLVKGIIDEAKHLLKYSCALMDYQICYCIHFPLKLPISSQLQGNAASLSRIFAKLDFQMTLTEFHLSQELLDGIDTLHTELYACLTQLYSKMFFWLICPIYILFLEL